jgi:hypothetical protein
LVICGESQVILSRDDIQRTTIQYGTRVGYFVVLFLAISSSVYAQDQLPDLVRRIKPSAVAIETFDARGEKLTRGSGFFIDKIASSPTGTLSTEPIAPKSI